MKKLLLSTVGFITALSLVSTVWGFEISRALTRAEIMMDASGAPVLDLNFRAELIGFPPDPTRVTVAIHWEEVGGVDPEPFDIVIPAGCFVANRRGGFSVPDFSACGVKATFGTDASGAPRILPIMDFAARLSPPMGSFLLGLGLQEVPVTDLTNFLSALGGAGVQIMIGNETAEARPRRVETVVGD